MANIELSRKEQTLRAYPTGAAFATEMNPVNCMIRFSEYNTPEKCACSNKLTLSEIIATYGNDFAIDFLQAWLINLNMFVNVKNRLEENQLFEISLIMKEDNLKLNIADLAFIFRRVKSGFYGKLFNSLSGEFILNCFAEYRLEREKSLHRHSKNAQDSNNIYNQASFLTKGLEYMPNTRAFLSKLKKESKRP